MKKTEGIILQSLVRKVFTLFYNNVEAAHKNTITILVQ